MFPQTWLVGPRLFFIPILAQSQCGKSDPKSAVRNELRADNLLSPHTSLRPVQSIPVLPKGAFGAYSGFKNS